MSVYFIAAHFCEIEEINFSSRNVRAIDFSKHQMEIDIFDAFVCTFFPHNAWNLVLRTPDVANANK